MPKGSAARFIWRSPLFEFWLNADWARVGYIRNLPKSTREQTMTKTPSEMAKGALLSLAFLSAFSATASAMEFTKPTAVVELFTSQGCSSCPPADATLKQLNAGDAILGLAMHVDYWDRLGWKDTFASSENTERQWRYARSFGERQVYTPQAVINGRDHVVGSRKSDIIGTAANFDSNGSGLEIPVNLEKTGETIRVSVPKNTTGAHTTLYAIYFTPSAAVEIKRGENAGKTISYSNIVGRVEMIGMVGADGLTTDFSIADIRQKGYKGCALILQEVKSDGLPGPIVGASVIKDL